MKKEVDYLAVKGKIKEFLDNYNNVVSSDYLERIVKAIDTQNKADILVEMRAYLSKYGNIILKSSVGKALYELIDIFSQIDEFEKEQEENEEAE
ncbi:MAG: hypothetical protein N4A38_03785 [Candidatus Gracilibacteria bacterium]|nr:hypothetical protein [Candidatus Gracilibacteria bacterium]